MKRNELISLTINVLNASNSALSAQDQVRAAKKAARESADKIINYFADDLTSLVSFLNDTYTMLRKEQAFGDPDAKTESGNAIWKYRAQNWARYFHRSFASLDNGLKLSGMSPFKISEATVKITKSPMETLLDTAGETVGLDEQLRAEIEKAVSRFQARNRKRQKELEKTLKAEISRNEAARKRAALEQAAEVLAQAGFTAAEIEERVAAINEN